MVLAESRWRLRGRRCSASTRDESTQRVFKGALLRSMHSGINEGSMNTGMYSMYYLYVTFLNMYQVLVDVLECGVH